MILPRDFFIEDRLEKHRLNVSCNLGESGIRNKTLEQILYETNTDIHELTKLSLSDSPNSGSIFLREEIAKLYEGVHPDEVLVTTGTGEALYILFCLLLEKGSRVSLFTPAFQALYEIPRTLGSIVRSVNITDHFVWEELFSQEQNLVIINHPHNPTGVGLSHTDPLVLKSYLDNYSGHVLFDEHYRFLADDFPSFSGAKVNDRCYTTGSITKCFGVVGLRIGWLIAPKKLISKARSFKDYLTHTVNPISEFLTIKILQNLDTLIPKTKETIQNNIRYLQNHIKEMPSIKKFFPPQGGIVSFLELEEGVFSEHYCDRLLELACVFVLPGTNFEKEGFIRVGFGEEEKRFMDGINRWVDIDKIITCGM
jgi:aspartate/methionine/tyrosine aminotransferase